VAHEIEIKLAVSSVAAIRRRVRALGFAVTSPRQLEQNLLFEASDNSLSGSGQLLRLRSKGKRWWLTWKAPAGAPGQHKIRDEIETELMDGDQMQQVLIRLGFQPAFEYQKYRTEFQVPGQPGTLLLDETPIGNFIELEGEPAWIDRLALELGYTPEDYILASYGLLFLRWRHERGLPPHDMVFERKKTLRRSQA
jgi:adenylate cyclase, class 2